MFFCAKKRVRLLDCTGFGTISEHSSPCDKSREGEIPRGLMIQKNAFKEDVAECVCVSVGSILVHAVIVVCSSCITTQVYLIAQLCVL